MVVVEALAVGVPLVASDVGDVGDNPAAHRSRHRCPRRRREAFTAACERLLRDPDERARLAARAREAGEGFDASVDEPTATATLLQSAVRGEGAAGDTTQSVTRRSVRAPRALNRPLELRAERSPRNLAERRSCPRGPLAKTASDQSRGNGQHGIRRLRLASRQSPRCGRGRRRVGAASTSSSTASMWLSSALIEPCAEAAECAWCARASGHRRFPNRLAHPPAEVEILAVQPWPGSKPPPAVKAGATSAQCAGDPGTGAAAEAPRRPGSATCVLRGR